MKKLNLETGEGIANCAHCGVRVGFGHGPTCELISHEDAKVSLAVYYEAWHKQREELVKLRLKNKIDGAHWHGKFAVLKIENNALRKKVKTLELCVLGLSENLK